MEKDKLEEYRERIDMLDSKIVELLGERMKVVDNVGEYKKEKGLPVTDEDREKILFEKVREMGKDTGLDEDFIQELFERIINQAKKRE